MNSLDPAARAVIYTLFDGAFSQLWPMLLLPALAALICHRAAAGLSGARTDWRMAAWLAAVPGFVMLSLLIMIFCRASIHFHPGDFSHVLQYHVPLLLGCGLIARAMWRQQRRRLALRTLTALAKAPSPRLAAAAHVVGLRVVELPGDACECFIFGAIRPTAFVSSGAVARMSDEELVAALHHERAHGASGDPAMLEILTFLGDLAPGSSRALTAYRCARERRADAEAAERAGACALASALLVMTRAHAAPRAGAFSMGGHGDGAWRLEALLGVERRAQPSRPSALLQWSSLSTSGALLLWPVAHVGIAYQLCG